MSYPVTTHIRSRLHRNSACWQSSVATALHCGKGSFDRSIIQQLEERTLSLLNLKFLHSELYLHFLQPLEDSCLAGYESFLTLCAIYRFSFYVLLFTVSAEWLNVYAWHPHWVSLHARFCGHYQSVIRQVLTAFCKNVHNIPLRHGLMEDMTQGASGKTKQKDIQLSSLKIHEHTVLFMGSSNHSHCCSIGSMAYRE